LVTRLAGTPRFVGSAVFVDAIRARRPMRDGAREYGTLKDFRTPRHDEITAF
jgi:hypothetical protein